MTDKHHYYGYNNMQLYGILGDLYQISDKKYRFMEILESCLTQRKESGTNV